MWVFSGIRNIFPTKRSRKWCSSMCPLRLGHPGFGMLASASATGRWRWRTQQWPYPSRWEAVERGRRLRRSPGGRRAASGRRSRSLSFLEREKKKRTKEKREKLSHLIRLLKSTIWGFVLFSEPQGAEMADKVSEGLIISPAIFKYRYFKLKHPFRLFFLSCCNYDTELLMTFSVSVSCYKHHNGPNAEVVFPSTKL